VFKATSKTTSNGEMQHIAWSSSSSNTMQTVLFQ